MVSARKRGRPGKSVVAVEEPVASKRRSSGRKQNEDVIVSVRSFRKIGGVDHYQVEWASDTRKDSWEPAKDVKKVAKSLVDEYEASVQADADEREYEVEKLVDRKKVGKGDAKTTKYLVKWKGFSSEESTWELGDDLPKDQIKAFEKEFGEAGSAKKSEPNQTVSIVKGRKAINNVLHYEVKFVGQSGAKWLPIYEIPDIEAIKEWEEGQYNPEINTEMEKEIEFTVEKITGKRGSGSRAQYRVKWVGYPSSKNSWEPLSNLGGATKMVKAWDKMEKEKELKVAETDYEIQKIVEEKLFRNKPVYLVRWKGFSPNSDTWEPTEQFAGAPEALADWEEEKKKRTVREAERKKRAEERKESRKVAKEEAKKVAAVEGDKKTETAAPATDEPAAKEATTEPAAKEEKAAPAAKEDKAEPAAKEDTAEPVAEA